MPLSVDTLRGAFLGLGPLNASLPGDADTLERLRIVLDAAKVACAEYTHRQLDPLPATGPGTHTVTRRVRGSRVVRVPDLRELAAVTVGGNTVDVDDVELMWSEPHPWVRLPFSVDGRVLIEGLFGYAELPADLSESIYTYAARRYRERDAGYSDSVDLGDGSMASYFRTMPPSVRDTWDRYRVPDRTVVSVRVGGA